MKNILYEKRDEIQTRFDILNCFYPTKELKIIPFINQENY